MDPNELPNIDDIEKNSTKPIGSVQKPPDLPVTVDAETSMKNLKQHKSCIIEKLAQTRRQLEFLEADLESDSAKEKEHDKRVLAAFELLTANLPDIGNSSKLLPSTSQQEKKSFDARNLLPVQLPKKCMKQLPSGENIDSQSNECVKQLPSGESEDFQSEEYFLAIIEGFEQLVLKLASDRTTFLNAIGKVAQTINILKDLPLFKNIEEERIKLKCLKKRTKDLIFSDEGARDVTHDDNSRKTAKTSVEKFCKYINSMISERASYRQETVPEKFKCFPKHIDDLETFSNVLVQEGIGKIVERDIRINSKNNHQAFISMSNGEVDEIDAIIPLPVARRYAFHGDIVRAFVINSDYFGNKTENVQPNDENRLDSSTESANNSLSVYVSGEVADKELCRKAFVIKIIKQTELREVVGSVKARPKIVNSERHYTLRPYDTKISMVYIPEDMCKEEDLINISNEYICGMIYVARIIDVDMDGRCIGELIQPVGKVGELQPEIDAILLSNDLKDFKPYAQKYQEMFEGPIPPVNDEDLKNREDLRKKCVFTIDPLTAKDLDDAVSVEKLSSSEYEVGVHISDVSYYLQENTELDDIVQSRTTSVYLLNQVIHMLPTSLCLRCSLLPGDDKFAFSVFWKWHTEKQELSAPRFVRSIINSCSQLAYEHAQKIIDNPTEHLDTIDLPDIFNGWTPNDIKSRILILHQIAQKLKAERYENGAISINNAKICFKFDPKSGEPVEIVPENRQEAQFLIEELMLLANQAVAKYIHIHYPAKSILRQHSPPMARQMKALKERLKKVGLDFDISSSKSVFESMQRLSREADNPKAMEAGLNDLLTKPMSRAKYFCSEGKTSEAEFWHYGLSIPIYTHFTSPIRRYADVTVHRLLAAALNYCPPPQRNTDELHQLAGIMNAQKFKAKKSGDDVLALYFKRYLKAKKSIVFDAVVTEIGDHSVNVVIIETSQNIAIRYHTQDNVTVYKNSESNCIKVCNNIDKTTNKLELFSNLKINLTLLNDQLVASFASCAEPCGRHSKVVPEFHRSNISVDCLSSSCEDEDDAPAPSSNPKKNKTSRVRVRSKRGGKKHNKGRKTQDYTAFYRIKNDFFFNY